VILAAFWPVDDLAACLVPSRCTERWRRQGSHLAQALAEALGWLSEGVEKRGPGTAPDNGVARLSGALERRNTLQPHSISLRPLD
jgi:CHAT domain-containing protein